MLKPFPMLIHKLFHCNFLYAISSFLFFSTCALILKIGNTYFDQPQKWPYSWAIKTFELILKLKMDSSIGFRVLMWSLLIEIGLKYNFRIINRINSGLEWECCWLIGLLNPIPTSTELNQPSHIVYYVTTLTKNKVNPWPYLVTPLLVYFIL